ncbi:MAG: hypothetical protein AB1806_15215 [Acidobacteriota bacterium]
MAQRRIDQLTDDALFDDWVKWIGRVENELIGIAWNRRLFREVSRVFSHNTHLQQVGGFLYDWLRLNYTAGVAMAFRREVDRANAMGFVHLLGEIVARPQVLSRRRHYDRWTLRSSFEEELRRKSFDVMPFVSPSDDPLDDHIDPAAVRADIDTIRTDTEIVHDYVEQTIAHRAWGEQQSITFVQFNAAVDALTPIFKRYYARLTQSSLMQMSPVPQYNVHLPFTFPWDVTCNRLWDEARGNQPLPWSEIGLVYRDDPIDEEH